MIHPYMALQLEVVLLLGVELEVVLNIHKLHNTHPNWMDWVDLMGSNLHHRSYTLGCYCHHHIIHHQRNLVGHMVVLLGAWLEAMLDTCHMFSDIFLGYFVCYNCLRSSCKS